MSIMLADYASLAQLKFTHDIYISLACLDYQ